MKKTQNYKFIFYSLYAFALGALAWLWHPAEAGEFWRAWSLWQEPIFASFLVGLMGSILGVYILLGRMMLMSLGLSQAASLGILLFLWLGSVFSYEPSSGLGSLFSGWVLSLVSVALLARLGARLKLPQESLLALFYVLATGLNLLVADRLSQGVHEHSDFLLGNALAVTREDLWLAGISAVILVGIHKIFQRRFLASLADPTFLQILGKNTQRRTLLLYLFITLGLSVSLKTLGILPVLTLITLPAFIALKDAPSTQAAFRLSLLIGLTLPSLSYFYSYLFALPTGPAYVFIAALYLVGEVLRRSLKRLTG